MKLHQIEYFLAIEKYQSFSTAALEINVSQSTLSQQIAALEKELGVHLFVRHNRNVYLTRAGQEFLICAQNIMREVAKAQELMQKYSSCERGLLRLGLLPALMHVSIKDLIVKFTTTYKNIEIIYHLDDTDSLLEQIRSRKIHLAFVSAPFAGEFEVDFYPIINEYLVLLVNLNHPLAQKARVDILDLDGENLLLHKVNSTIYKTLKNAFKKAGINFRPVAETDNVDLIRTFVENNLGVSLLGNQIAQNLLTAKITTVPFFETIHLQSGLAVPTSFSAASMIPPITKTFRDFTLKELAK